MGMAPGNVLKALALAMIFIALAAGIAHCSPGVPAFIGQRGGADGCFNCPKGVAIDSGGNIYVLDDLNCRVQKFSPDGTFIKKWGSKGSGDGQFSGQASNLESIAIDGDDNIYITDGSHRVQVFDADGNFLNAWNYRGTGTGEFESTVGIAVDRWNNVFVADYLGSKVLKFDRNGTFIKEWYEPTEKDGQFWGAWGITTDDDGNVFVTGYWNDHVYEFTNNGTFIREWGSRGSGDGQFSHPEGIVVDAGGNVFVADNANNNIQEFSSNGTFIKKWDNALNNYSFKELAGLALDKKGNLYAANYKGYNVIIISGVAQPPQATTRPQPTPNGGTISQFRDNPLYMYGFLCCCPTAIVIFAIAIVAFFLWRRRSPPEEPENFSVYGKDRMENKPPG